MYDWKEILGWFEEDPEKIEEPDEILYAEYDNGGYDGSVEVLFVDNGKFYYVSGGHCSCYGLEDQWSPEEYTIEQLRGQVERANYGFFKDQAAVLLEACDRYESDVGNLVSKISAGQARLARLDNEIASLGERQLELKTERDRANAEVIEAKLKLKNLL